MITRKSGDGLVNGNFMWIEKATKFDCLRTHLSRNSCYREVQFSMKIKIRIHVVIHGCPW